MRTIVHGKRQWFFVAAAGGLLIAAAFSVFFRPAPTSAGVDDNLRGFAWSDTIGWISFNCTDPGTCGAFDYGVNIDANGLASGWAWSDNIGWISFNDNGCPPGVPIGGPGACQPKVLGGDLRGWARACAGTVNGDCTGASRTDGWDGWISLSCNNPVMGGGGCGFNYGVNVAVCNSLTGYAWGSDVVGWISFSGIGQAGGGAYGVIGTCPAPPLVVSCEADPNPGRANQDIFWTVKIAGGTPKYTTDWYFDEGTGNKEYRQTSTDGSVTSDPPKQYSDPGRYTLRVVVTDDGEPSQRDEKSCNVDILSRRREVRPEAP